MKGDGKVVEFLNKALRHELTAVNQYWLHYRLLDNLGLQGPGEAMAQGIDRGNGTRRQAGRAHHFSRRFPNMQVLDPCISGRT
jgi:bacterioferritin